MISIFFPIGFVFCLFWILIGRTLIMHGTFFDGLTYSYVSLNYARDYGRFWAPTFDRLQPFSFFEHPPLHFWFQGQFYKVFGSSIWVDKVFSFILILFFAMVVKKFWSEFANASKAKSPNYLWPLTSLLLIPILGWCLRYPMLENTLGLVTSMTILGFVIIIKRFTGGWWWAGIIIGLGSLIAFFVKGPVGLFPLVTPLLWQWSNKFSGSVTSLMQKDTQQGDEKKTKKTSIEVGQTCLSLLPNSKTLLICSSALLVFCLCLGLIMISIPEAQNYLKYYLQYQVIASLKGLRESKASPIVTILRMLSEVVPLILFSLAVGKNRKQALKRSFEANSSSILFFFMTALSASLPLLISPKQRAFYLAPSMFFYGLTLALLFSEMIRFRLEQLNEIFSVIKGNKGQENQASRLWLFGLKALTLLFFLFPLLDGFLNYGLESRDHFELEFVHRLNDHLRMTDGEASRMTSVTPKFNLSLVGPLIHSGEILGYKGPYDWSLINYLRRYRDQALDFDRPWSHRWVIASMEVPVERGFRVIWELQNWRILKKERMDEER